MSTSNDIEVDGISGYVKASGDQPRRPKKGETYIGNNDGQQVGERDWIESKRIIIERPVDYSRVDYRVETYRRSLLGARIQRRIKNAELSWHNYSRCNWDWDNYDFRVKPGTKK